MRRGLYFMLMVVLVLRGLTGTAMAAGVLAPLSPMAGAQHQHAPLPDDPQAHSSMHGVYDASEHAHSAAVSAAVAASCDSASTSCAEHDHHASTCSACGICHSAMLDSAALLAPAQHASGTRLPISCAQFDSAPAALVIKPPIA